MGCAFARLRTTWIGRDGAIDGEVVCLDAEGKPQFYELFRGRSDRYFYAFDLLWPDGKDLRSPPLIERKRKLRSIIPKPPAAILYADHVRRTGCDLFRAVCEQDLEGVVAKHANGLYTPDTSSWVKIENRD